MIDGTDLISLETDVRDLIGEETAKFWTQARVFRAINSEVMRLARRVIALDNGWFDKTYTPTVASSITLPVNCYLVRNLELYVDNQWMSPTFIGDHQRGVYQDTSNSSTFPSAAYFEGGTIVFQSGIGSASQCRIKYARLPAEMRYETLASGSATTAVMSSGSAIDDVYIGDKFVVLSGTGAGQISTITDYVASTYTLTVASGATLDSTTIISWLLPDPLAKYPDVVALGAAIRLLHRRRDSELIGNLMQEYQMDVQDMLEALSQRQTLQAQRGNFIPDGYTED